MCATGEVLRASGTRTRQVPGDVIKRAAAGVERVGLDCDPIQAIVRPTGRVVSPYGRLRSLGKSRPVLAA
jgi:hypothetical protein